MSTQIPLGGGWFQLRGVAGHVTYRNTRSGQHCSIFPDVTRDKLTQQELTLQCPQFQKSGFGRRSCKICGAPASEHWPPPVREQRLRERHAKMVQLQQSLAAAPLSNRSSLPHPQVSRPQMTRQRSSPAASRQGLQRPVHPQRQHSSPSVQTSKPVNLGDGWFKVWDHVAKKFYYANSRTKQSQWHEPSIAAAPAAPAASPGPTAQRNYTPALSPQKQQHQQHHHESRSTSTSSSWDLDADARAYFYGLGIRGLTTAYENARQYVHAASEVEGTTLERAQQSHKFLTAAIEQLMQVMKHTAISSDTYIRIAFHEMVKKLLTVAETAQRQVEVGESNAGVAKFQTQLQQAKYGEGVTPSSKPSDTPSSSGQTKASSFAGATLLKIPFPQEGHCTVRMPEALVNLGSGWEVDGITDAARTRGPTVLAWPPPVSRREWITRNYATLHVPREERHNFGEITVATLTSHRWAQVKAAVARFPIAASGGDFKAALVYRHDVTSGFELTRLANILCELELFLRAAGGWHPQIHSASAMFVHQTAESPPTVGPTYECYIELMPILDLPLDAGQRLLDWIAPLQQEGSSSDQISARSRNASGISCGHEDWLLQSMVRQLLQALASLHSTKIVAGFLVPEHVFVYDLSSSIKSKDDTGAKTSVGTAVRLSICGVPSSKRFASNHSFSAPEVKSGTELPSAASDMWMVGAIVWYALQGQVPVLLPGDDCVKLPASFRRRHGDRLSDFLQQLLQRDGSKRLRCHEAVISAYLNTSLVVDREADGQIVALQNKKEALFECIQSMRSSRGRLYLRIRREALVDDVAQALLSAPRSDLLRKFSVQFDGEPGVDAGGLTAEMYSSFFRALLSPESLLFESSGSEESEGKVLYLPKRLGAELCDDMRDELLSMLEGVGRLLVKAIFDGQPVPAPFAPSLYKYLLGMDPNLHDLAAFDPTLSEQLRMLLDAEDAEDLGIDFEDVGDPPEDVTNENRERYLRRAVIYHLVDCRSEELEYFARGFKAIGIHAHLKLFSAAELMGIVYGQQDATASAILDVTEFGLFSRSSTVPEMFRRALEQLSGPDLTKFLLFVTAQSAVPPPSKKIKIVPMTGSNASPASFPIAHTCFHRLEVPEYETFEQLTAKLQFCIDNVEMAGFGFA